MALLIQTVTGNGQRLNDLPSLIEQVRSKIRKPIEVIRRRFPYKKYRNIPVGLLVHVAARTRSEQHHLRDTRAEGSFDATFVFSRQG